MYMGPNRNFLNEPHLLNKSIRETEGLLPSKLIPILCLPFMSFSYLPFMS